MAQTVEVSEAYQKLLVEGLKEVTERGYTEEHELFDARKTFYREVDHVGAFFETYSVNGIGDIPKFNGKLESLVASPGYLTRVEPVEFGAMRQWQRKFLDDKKYDVLNDDSRELGIAAARTVNKYCAYPFIYATSNMNEFMTTEEGVSLCNTAHLTKANVSTATGFSNALTGALNATNLATTRLLGANIKSPIATRMGTNFDTLVVPNALAQKAFEITATQRGLYSGEGTENFWKKQAYKVIVWNLLDDYSTTDWYLVDSAAMKRYLMFWERIAPEFTPNHDFQTKITQMGVYFRFGLGYSNWRWILKNTVS
jgi:hypothetical protein